MFRGHGDGFSRRSRRLAGDKVWRTDLDLKVSGERGLLDVLGDALIATILVVSQNAGGLEEETPSGLDWVCVCTKVLPKTPTTCVSGLRWSRSRSALDLSF